MTLTAEQARAKAQEARAERAASFSSTVGLAVEYLLNRVYFAAECEDDHTEVFQYDLKDEFGHLLPTGTWNEFLAAVTAKLEENGYWVEVIKPNHRSGFTRIAIHWGPKPEPKPEPQKSWFRRLFGF